MTRKSKFKRVYFLLFVELINNLKTSFQKLQCQKIAYFVQQNIKNTNYYLGLNLARNLLTGPNMKFKNTVIKIILL